MSNNRKHTQQNRRIDKNKQKLNNVTLAVAGFEFVAYCDEIIELCFADHSFIYLIRQNAATHSIFFGKL